MKIRSLAALICALTCAILPARAENAFVFPTPQAPFSTPEPDAPAEGGMRLSVMGETLTLDYDADPAYSLVEDGCVQASFYAYAQDGTLYELYLIFPDTVAAGSTVTPQTSPAGGSLDAGVMLFVTDGRNDISALATQSGSAAFPEGSSYSIQLTDVSRDGASAAFAGSFEATLMAVDAAFTPLYPIENVTGAFRFTMNLGLSAASPAPDIHLPGLIAPPDAKKI